MAQSKTKGLGKGLGALFGEIPPVEEYEAIPYLEQMEERLAFGRDYLNGVLDKLKLRG